MLAEFRRKVRPKRIKAVMEKPSLLVLDEPFNGIDVDGLEQMREIIRTIKKRGATIILASHNQDDMNQLCDYIYYMEKGKIISFQSNVANTSTVPL